MIDTYWSDHCRHTTFCTHSSTTWSIDDAARAGAPTSGYLAARAEVYGRRRQAHQTLMDIATIGAKYLKKPRACSPELDESEEINACTVHDARATVDGEDRAVAAAVQERDPQPPHGDRALRRRGHLHRRRHPRPALRPRLRLSGHARHRRGRPADARVTRRCPASCRSASCAPTAAAGYSSYGNQIGLATGMVDEIYHPGYVAKRMEIGAVVAAAPADNVRRERPRPGDVVILLGGRTGRDGMRRRDRLLQEPTPCSRWRPAAPRCRRATPPRSASSSACSATAKLPASSSAATTSARAACPWPSASWPTAWTST